MPIPIPDQNSESCALSLFKTHLVMRNRDPHRENVENILAISLPIVTMQHIKESPSASHAMRISVWNVYVNKEWTFKFRHIT